MAADRIPPIIGFFIAVVALLLGAAADTYYVGDGIAWAVPSAGAEAYRSWAAEKTFKLGDTIGKPWMRGVGLAIPSSCTKLIYRDFCCLSAVFNWTGEHTVARVSKDVYDNCTTANVLAQDTQTTSPVNVTLNSMDPQYFICTIGPHCSLGQKVTVTISSAAALTVQALTTMLLTSFVFTSI